MKYLLAITAAALWGLTASAAWAPEAPPQHAGTCDKCDKCEKHCHCMHPEPYCPDCSKPCDKCRLPTLYGKEHAQELMDQLCKGGCCERIKAAKKLGCQLHANFCCNPEVLTALVKALQCDTCWEVRRAAAWAIQHQDARVPQGIVALYLAGKLDPHYMVRDSAKDALDVLVVCRHGCYKDLFTAADALAKQVKAGYKPTSGSCVDLVTEFCAHAGELVATPGAPMPPEATTLPKPEQIPPPKVDPGEAK